VLLFGSVQAGPELLQSNLLYSYSVHEGWAGYVLSVPARDARPQQPLRAPFDCIFTPSVRRIVGVWVGGCGMKLQYGDYYEERSLHQFRLSQTISRLIMPERGSDPDSRQARAILTILWLRSVCICEL
jgi:hypothetical protein